MDPILKHKLAKIAEDIDEQGFEEAIMDNLSAEDFMDLETMLSNEINTAEGIEFDKLTQLRYFFRIICKFHTDLHRGINRLDEYLPDHLK